jgi:hypothetical protein
VVRHERHELSRVALPLRVARAVDLVRPGVAEIRRAPEVVPPRRHDEELPVALPGDGRRPPVGTSNDRLDVCPAVAEGSCSCRVNRSASVLVGIDDGREGRRKASR